MVEGLDQLILEGRYSSEVYQWPTCYHCCQPIKTATRQIELLVEKTPELPIAEIMCDCGHKKRIALKAEFA